MAAVPGSDEEGAKCPTRENLVAERTYAPVIHTKFERALGSEPIGTRID